MTDMRPTPILLHIGCGAAESLPRGAADAGPVFLVEPNPALLPALRQLAAGSGGRITLIEAAVAGETGSAPFRLLSIEDLSGLADPAGLQALMPGLRVIDEFRVPTLGITDLLAQIGPGHDLAPDDLAPEAEPADRLIIEALGQEAVILAALRDSGALGRFADITVQTAQDPLEPGGPSAAGIAALLAAEGYRPQTGLPPADPDLPLLAFRQDPALRRMLHSMARAEARIAAQDARSAEQAAVLAGLQDSLTRKEAELAAAESRASEQAAAQELRLQDLVSSLTETAAARARAEDLAAELQRQLQAQGERLETGMARLRDQLDARAAELAEARAAAQTEAQALQETLEGQALEIKGLQDHVAVLLQERDAAQANADREQADALTCRKTLESAQIELAAGQMEQQRLMARISELDAALNRARGALETAENTRAAQDMRFNEHQIVVKEEIRTLNARMEALGKAADGAKADLAAARKMIEEERGRIRDGRVALARAETDLAALRAALAQDQARADQAEAAVQRLTADLAEARDTIAAERKRIQQGRDALAQRERTLAAAQDSLLQEQTRAATCSAEVQRLTVDLVAARDTIAAERKRIQQGRDLIARMEPELANLRSTLTHEGKRLQDTAARAAQAEADLARLRETQAQTEAAEARARKDLGIALRLQALNTADLKDLQARHARVQEEKARQDLLIGQLALRLGEASDHLRRLNGLPVAAPPPQPAFPQPGPQPAPPMAVLPETAPEPTPEPVVEPPVAELAVEQPVKPAASPVADPAPQAPAAAAPPTAPPSAPPAGRRSKPGSSRKRKP